MIDKKKSRIERNSKVSKLESKPHKSLFVASREMEEEINKIMGIEDRTK